MAKRRAKNAQREGCDVRLVVAGDTVKAEPIIRHLRNALGEPWCCKPEDVEGEITDKPAEATCRKCFAARLKEMQRQARLRGDFWLLGEKERREEYDGPFERMSAAQVNTPLVILAELTDGVKARKAKRASKEMPGSAAKQDLLADRVRRNESTSHRGDRGLNFLSAALRVENNRNGSTEVLGVATLTGPVAEAAHQEQMERVASDDLRERSESVWHLLSGEAFLARLEARVGRSLNAAARAIAAWPWGRRCVW